MSKVAPSSPPMTYTKSGVRTNGAHSLLKPWKGRGEGGGGRREGGGEKHVVVHSQVAAGFSRFSKNISKPFLMCIRKGLLSFPP